MYEPLRLIKDSASDDLEYRSAACAAELVTVGDWELLKAAEHYGAAIELTWDIVEIYKSTEYLKYLREGGK